MTDAVRDQNHVTVALGVSSTSATTTLPFTIDPVTGRLLVDNAGGGSGTVTSVSVTSANGFAGTVATATTTPAITISTTINSPVLAGNGTAISAATTTGSGSTVVLQNTPTLTTPVIGAATGTSLVLSSSLTSGAVAGVTGSVLLKGLTSGTVTLSVADAAGTWTMKLPTSAGTNGYFLKTDGSGNTSWDTGPAASLTVGTTAIASGTTTRVLYDNAGTLGEYTISGSGNVAMTTSPIFTTPTLGVASATSLATSAASPLLLTNGQLVTVALTAQTVGGATLTIPDFASVSDEFTFKTKAQTMSNKTLSGVTISDGTNIVLDTTTGTKIGTATTQKLAFFNSTPIVQPTGDIVTAMQNLGLGASLTVSAATTITTANEATDTTCFPLFVTASGTQTLQPKNNVNLTFNSSTAALGATLLTATTSVTSASILASSNDSGALGAAATAFSDLFLASGAVIGFANSNVVLTHSTGILTVSTGDLRVTTAGTNSASVVTVGGTQTLTAKTLTSPAVTTGTYTGTQLLAEGASIGLDPSLSADGTWTGITMTGTAGYTQAFGDLVYLDPTDSRWEAADADVSTAADGDPRGILAMVVVAGTDGNSCTLLLQGVIRADTAFPAMTVNAAMYVGETAGDIQATIPTGADNVIRVVGQAITADALYFNPSPDWQITVA